MASVDIEEAKNAIRDILSEGQREGKLNLLTVRIVLQKVEQKLGLEENTLMEGEHKKPLRNFIKEESSKARETKVTKQKEEVNDVSPAKPKPSSTASAKRKSDAGGSATPKKRPKAEDLEEKQERVKAKPVSRSKDVENSDAGPSDGPKKQGSFKSKETIDTDSEAGNDSPRKAAKKKPTNPSSKGRKRKSDEVANDKEPEALPVKSEAKIEEDGNRSGSELSVLIDDPPAKQTKGKGSKTSKTKTEGKKLRTKKSESALSPDEEQIKKLKSLVVACGVRKVWARELKDCETPASQISHLRKLLTELGMTGRFSLEQAKSIRAKRELAQELEDVKDFAERFTRDRPKRDNQEDDGDDESDDAEELLPRQRKTAHASIMAFLDDQSSDSE